MENKSFDNVSWLLGDPISNFCMSIVDDFVRTNADFHYKAGLYPRIIRSTDGKCCEWCSKLAGVYEYADVSGRGNDVFRRHRNCGCIVVYDPADGTKQYQNVHSKKWTSEVEYGKLLQEKDHITPRQQEAVALMKQKGGKISIPAEMEGNFSDFEQLTITNKEHAVLDNIRQRTVKTGFEEGCVKQQNGSFRYVAGTEKNGIEITIIDEDGSVIGLFHTHTNDTLFSEDDFKRFVDTRVECIGVVTDNEDVFICKVGSGWRPDSEDEFKDIIKELRKQADDNVMADPRFLEWTYEERVYMAVREQAYLTARYFGWELQGGKL